MNNQDNDKTVRKESVPPMSSGTHEQGGPLLETGMMQPPQTPGTLGMIGKYQVIRILGEGGMGQVLLAREPVTDSLVAIKIIKPEYLKKDWAVHRFLTEARHMFKMSHPSMIRVLEVSDRPEGPYFVMPYMAGGSLAQKIKPGEALPSDVILKVARQVAEALQYAHTRGIIHRDLKPSNILLDNEGGACLCDFGLLRTVFNDSVVDVTKPQVEGTVPYMSPAVAEGKAEDTRCDIYGFGCLLYEMLTGQPPYQGPTVDAILKRIQAGPPQPILQLNPNASARLAAIAEHAMGRELRDRYAAMSDVIRDLDRAARGKEPLGPRGLGKGAHLGRNLLAVIGVVALVWVAALTLSNLPERQGGVEPETTLQDQFSWTTNNGWITITKYTGPGGGVTIPGKINGLPVTGIGHKAFWQCAGVTNVLIPTSVTCIGADAFAGCAQLTGVIIPNNVNYIEPGAFSDCSSLTSLKIPNGVSRVDERTFWRCASLTNVLIPSSVISIIDCSFYGCSRLLSISVAAANPSYSSVNGILYNKQKTTLLCYPSGRSSSCVIPGNPIRIGAGAFCGSTNLIRVTFPASVASIGAGAFWDCTNLSSLTLPDKVTDIEDRAFLGCRAVTNIYFKGNAPKLGWDVFRGVQQATIYYLPDTKGWGQEFGGLPTAPWNPQASNAASPAATAQTPFTCTTNNGAITITKYTGPGGAVTIPSTISGLPVASIGGDAFRNCGSLTSVSFPNSVTSIGGAAFWGCVNLTNVTIPNSLTSIGDWVFQYCTGLTRVTIPNSVTNIGQGAFIRCSGLNSISVGAANPAYSSSADGVLFNKEKTCLVSYPAGKAGSYVIPNRVARIGFAAFDSCTKLTSVTIPNSVTNIGHWAFLACTSLTNVTILDGVTSIEDRAFQLCPNLTSIIIPSGVTSIGSLAFEGCTGLTNVTIPASVTSIGGAAFGGCSALNAIRVNAANPAFSSADSVVFNKEKTIVVLYPPGKAGSFEIPSGVTKIGPTAFKETSYVTSVTIPESVTDIGAEAFRKCENLTAVYFKGNAPRLGKDVFEDNPKLKIYYLSDKTGWGGEFGGRPTKVWSGQASSAAALMPPLPPVILPASRASLAALRGEFDWTVNNNAVTITKYKGQGGAVVIPSQVSGLPVTVIGDWSFRDCSALTSVTIPDSVTAIGWCVFHNCAGLTNASISKSVATINGNPFRYCTSLTAIEVDAANPAFTSVEGVVYDKAKTRLQCYPCGRRGDYRIPEGLATIGQGSFEGSDKVTGVTIPNSVTEIGPYSFLNCARLAHINIPEGVARISDKAFEGCASLSKLSLPKSLAQLEWNPFRACTNLVSVEVHADNPNFASKDGVLFDKAGTKLVCYPGGRNGSYDVPKGVSVIGGVAFLGCVRLTAVTIPDGVTCLEFWAFSGCTRLASVTLPPSLATIRDHAFNDCSSLASITIPDTVTTIDDAAFASCTKLASIRFPSRITRIAPWMCWNCPNLTAVIIPPSVTSIGDIAFNSCSKLERITIPNSVTEIGNAAFAHCSKLAGIAVPDSVVKIGDQAFHNCSSLAAVTFGNRLVSIGKYCFRACALTQVTVPASVTTLGFNPFICCEKLASISVSSGNSFFCGVDGVLFNKEKTTLIGYPGGKPGGYTVPAGVTKIGGWAFHSNPRLTSVTIPESVKAIEECAFQGCDNLVGVKVQGDAPAVVANEFSGDNKATVGYLPGKKGWGKEFAGRPAHPMSGDFAYAEENNTMTIVRYLGAGGAVTIPDRINGIPVATIGGSAFSGCIDVTSVTIPKGVMTIRGWAFYGCTRLAKATIPDSVTSIGLGAFHSCPNLAGIKIPASVTSLDRASFSYDTALKSITVAPANPSYCSADGVLFSKDKTRLISYPCGRPGSYLIPKGVTAIGPNAFEGADKLTGVTIPDTVRAIENLAFLACSGLTGITIPHSVTNIADAAFQNSTNLAKVTLENGLVDIGNNAFIRCSKLASVAIPNSVMRIGDRAFYGTSLADVRIPSSVTSIGVNPFSMCGNLRSVTVDSANRAYYSKDGALLDKDMTCLISFSSATARSYEVPNTVTNIGDESFAGCYRLTGVTLPEKVARLGWAAFWACTNLTSVHCKGNAPADGGRVFDGGIDKATVYYLPETTGWGRDLAGRPTAPWNPPAK